MSWWPFGKKKKSSRAPVSDPLLKDNRTMISELRDACEMNFDNPEEARRQIRRMQVEWNDASQTASQVTSTEVDSKLERSGYSLATTQRMVGMAG